MASRGLADGAMREGARSVIAILKPDYAERHADESWHASGDRHLMTGAYGDALTILESTSRVTHRSGRALCRVL